MEKFSLYDLLGLILPGTVLIFMLDIARNIFNILPNFVVSDSWEIIILFSIILGSILYVLGFVLVKKIKFFNRIFGIFIHVTDSFLKIKRLILLNNILNKQANVWYDRDIYYSNKEYNVLSDSEKTEIRDLQDEFYDRMYYELEYENKMEVPKTFQSFYYFFRQLFIACIFSIIAVVLLVGISYLPFWQLSKPSLSILIYYLTGVSILSVLSVLLARWYRDRMVMKMYWAFYTHINSKQ